MADISFTEWDRRIFRIMSERTQDGLGRMVEALKDTPGEVPENLHLIINRHLGFHYGDNEGELPVELPTVFDNAVKTTEADASILSLVANSQLVHFYKDNLDHFNTHLILVAFILNDEALTKETEFLSYVLEEIIDEVELSLIEFRQDIEAGDFNVSAQDMHLFDWCAKRIEFLAGKGQHASN